MPINQLSDIPDNIRSNMSEACQRVFKSAFNDALDRDDVDGDEDAARIAWGAVKQSCSQDGGDNDDWTKDPEHSGNARTESAYVPTKYVSRQALEAADDPTAGPWTFSGVAVSAGDVLHMADGTPVLFTDEALRKAAASQSGKALTDDHPEHELGASPPRDATIGEVTNARYVPGKGVVYEARTHDSDIAAGIHAGTYDVSVHPAFKQGSRDPETGAIVAEDVRFTDLSVVSRGDSPSNTAQWGPSKELAAEYQSTDFDELLAADVEFSEVSYDGTSGGKLDKSALPSEGFASHFLLVGDSKSSSKYPVVDSSGNLRRGNVESAWSLRGQIPDSVSREDFEQYLRSLAENFDDLDLEASASESTASLFHRLGSRLGLTAGGGDGSTASPTASAATGADDPTDPADTDTPTTDMTDPNDPQNDSGTDAGADDPQNDPPEGGTNVVEVDIGDHDDFESYLSDTISEQVSQQVEAAKEADAKADLVDDLIAQSSEFDEDDREDLMASSRKILEAQHDSLTAPSAAGIPANGGAREIEASFDGGSDDVEEYGDGVLN